MVNPAFLFNDSKKILDSLVSASSLSSNLLEIEALSTKSFVQCLSNEDVGRVGAKVLNDGEQNWNEARWEERRPVVDSGINPSEEEVVITIRETVSFPEELLSSCLIEFCTSLWAKRHVNHVEVGITSPDFPVGPLVSLNSLVGPVPSILGFDDIEFTIESEGHN